MNGQYSNDTPWIVDPKVGNIIGLRHPNGNKSEIAYVGTNLPDIRAEETLYPYRVLMPGVNAFGAIAATTNGDTLLGVTDGTTRATGASQHALSGEAVRLQQGDFVQVTAGGTVVVSDLLIPTNEGKVIAYTGSSATCLLQAMQAGSNGTVIWCKKIAAVGIGGGSSPFVGGSWPSPTTTILWATDFLVNKVDMYSGSTQLLYSSPEYYWNGSASGATLTTDATNLAHHAGVMLPTITATNAVINIGQCQPNGWAGTTPPRMAATSAGTHETVFIVQPGGGYFLSTPTNRFTLYYGFSNFNVQDSYPDKSGTGSAARYGAFFRYSDNINAGKYQCVVRVNNGSGTPVEYTWDSGFTVDMSWMILKVELTAGTVSAPNPVVRFYINGNLVATADLNIAIGASEFLPDVSYYAQASMRGNTISTGGVFRIDYMHYYATVSRFDTVIGNVEA